MSIPTKKEKKGYREPTNTDKFDDRLRKAMEPCRKVRRYYPAWKNEKR